MFRRFIAYYKNNPEGYWFKRKLYGWGWVPVKWQGWLVIAVSIAIMFLGIYIGEIDDAPGVALLGIVVAIALVFGFSYWKGERPKWQWGLPKEKEENEEN